MKRTHGLIWKVCLLCCAVVILSSCAGTQGDAERERGENVKKLDCVVVLPAEASLSSEKSMSSAEIRSLRDGAKFLDGAIADELKSFHGASFLSEDQIEGMTTKISGSKLDMYKIIAEKMHCNAILTATVIRFHQREGGEYASDRPASVSFTMQLIRVPDGMVIWRTAFDETQESLLSNLLSIGKAQSRGFKWVTVEELTRQGVHERLSECPYL